MKLMLFGRAVYSGGFRWQATATNFYQPIAKLPFFAFFLVTDAARWSWGGLALWVKVT